RVVPGGVDPEVFAPGDRRVARDRLGISTDSWVVLAVRRLVPRMGLDVLLEAWQQLDRAEGQSLLLLAGEGPARAELESLAERLGIREQVRFLGTVSEADLVACYR